jgi:DNA-3-methyladenine glycosylase I
MTEADYRAIFSCVESTLILVGNQSGRKDDIRIHLDDFKRVETRANTSTDNDYFTKMVHVVFYAGFGAAKVTAKSRVIDRFFLDYRRVARYGVREVATMLSDLGMLRNKRKIQACIKNAQEVRAIVAQYASFRKYIQSFSTTVLFPQWKLREVMQLREDLRKRFAYVGSVISYHYLTDIGMPVLKPDRVIRRIFSRLRLVKDASEIDRRLTEVVRQGKKFAQATGHPIRYIDIVFAAHGQLKGEESKGLSQGICLEDRPRCSICGVRGRCRYRGPIGI